MSLVRLLWLPVMELGSSHRLLIFSTCKEAEAVLWPYWRLGPSLTEANV